LATSGDATLIELCTTSVALPKVAKAFNHCCCCGSFEDGFIENLWQCVRAFRDTDLLARLPNC
jgi:hypothetical protein